jgi:hypothetical protein
MVGWLICLLVLGFLATTLVGWWRHVSQRHYSSYLHPGDKYQVGQQGAFRVYTLPDLPMEPGMVQRLEPEFIDHQETLLGSATELLDTLGIDSWLNGATLQSFERQGCTMPADDSLSLGVAWEHRERLWGDAFARDAHARGLEVIFLRGATLNLATNEGAAVRLRHAGVPAPVLHIGFHKQIHTPDTAPPDERWYRVTGWWGDEHALDQNDICEDGWLFPTQTKTYAPSNLTLRVPATPLRVLQQQFGDNALTHMEASSPWLSHHTPFEMFPFAWRKQVVTDDV